MMKQIAKRALSLILVFFLILSIFPNIIIKTSADELNISGVLADVPGDTMGELVSVSADRSETNGTGSVTISKNVITIAAKGVSKTSSGCSDTPAKASTTTWTMRNTHGTAATVTYTFVKTSGDGTVSPASGTVTIPSGGTTSFQVTSAAPDTAAETKATLTLTGVTFAVQSCTTAFLQATNGSYSGSCSDGWQVAAGQSHQALSNQYYQLTAVPDPGYGFSAWIDGNGTILSRFNPWTMSPADRSVTAKFIPAGAAIYYIKGNASTEYYYLDLAIAAAGSSGTVIVKEDGKVLGSAGQTSFSIPSGVTLLVPYDAAATVITNDMESHVNEAYSNPPASTLYRKLTLPAGYRISVESGGKLCVCSQALNYSKGQVGPYGQLVLEQDSDITIKSGGYLYAYGYLSESANGTGTVTVQSGGTVYEDMMIMDYPGSATTANNLYSTEKIFPLRAYSLRNVEVPMTIQAGGTEYAFASIYGTSAGLHTANVKIIGNSSSEAFQISSGSMTKSYSGGRHCLTMNGSCALNDMSVSLATTIRTSSTSGLPMPSGFRIKAASGTVNINANVLLLEGTELTVDPGVSVNVASGKSIYVFDETDDAGAVSAKDYHGTAYTLVKSDCKIDVNGTVDIRGALYTTTNKANITSSEGTGRIRFSASAGTETSVKYKSGGSTASTANLTAAQLHNGANRPSGEEEYAATADAVNGDLFGYSSTLDMWLKNPVTVTFDANGGTGTMQPQAISKGADSVLAANGFTRAGYVFLGWNTDANAAAAIYSDGAAVNFSTDTTLYAIWEKRSVTYTITWKNYDGAILGTTTVDENTVPVYDGTPVRPDDAQYTYTFSGWTPEPAAATADAIYTAAYSAATRTYTVIWNNSDGSVLKTDVLEYGATPEYSGDAPTKAYDETSHYTFSGWQPAPSAVTGNAVYDPQFTAEEHTFAIISTTPAGCTTDGETTLRCSCGRTYTEAIPMTGHALVHHEAKAPTCTEIGWSAYDTCSRCDYTTYEELAALGHAEEEIPAVAATCTEPGLTEGVKCSRCGEILTAQETIPALGHNWSDWAESKAATCIEKGEEKRTCARCDAFETREVDALGHDYVDHAAKAPTCTEKGWNAYQTCSRCDYTTYEELAALGHAEEEIPAVAATCTEAGLTAGVKCSRCGEILTAQETIPALGHDWCEWTESKAATCTEKGEEKRICARCDAVEPREVNALGHDLVDHEAKAPTCTEIGWNAYQTCTRCDYSTYEEVAALGHAEEEIPAVAATCTEAGLTAGVKCSRCGAILTAQETIPALGHKPGTAVKENEVAPTCTKKGSYDEVVYCTVCNAELSRMSKEVDALGHDYGAWTQTKAPTCTEAGEEEHVCSRCGEKETRAVAAVGHDLIDHEAKVPTCTENGWNAYQTCSRCDYTTYEELAALGHAEEEIPAVAATCTEPGLTAGVKCSRCGEILTAQQTVPALGHNWSDWAESKTATCTEKGEEKRTCARCDAFETREVDALGHDYVDHAAKAPTCTEKGWNAYQTCSRCDYTTYEEIPALGHKPGTAVKENEVAPTCTEKGSYDEVIYCTICNAELSRTAKEIAALGHDYGAWTQTKAPTCTEAGEESRTCGRCHEKETRAVAALGHDLIEHEGKAPTCTEKGWKGYETCSRCDYTTYEELPATGHKSGTAVRENEIAPTCTEKGSYDEVIYCTVCNAELSRETKEDAALGHSFGEWAVTTSPTCTEKGIETRTCSRCEMSETREVAALGHDLVDRDAKAPTCTGIGWNAYQTCSRCDYTTYAELPATGHTPDVAVKENEVAPTCTEKGSYDEVVYCTVCNAELSRTSKEVDALGHDYGAWTQTKAPTCTEAGEEEHVCSRCGEKETRAVAAVGHDLIDHEAKVPTCTEIGWKAYQTCSRCDYTTYEEVAALGHAEEEIPAVAATCTAPGLTAGVKCSRCGEILTAQQTIPALGHDWSDWVESKAATCTEKGEEKRTCSRCGEAETREVDALGHDLVDHEAKAPTCTETGWNAYQTCRRCDYTTYEELAALGHQPVSDAAVAATCTEPGKTEGSHCGRCGQILTVQETIPAFGHKPGTAVRENEVAPTCTEKGSYDEVIYCTVCSAELSRTAKEVDALGHAFGVWTQTKAPTCTEAGEESRTCGRCGEKETRAVAALDHDLIDHEAKVPTCTEIGWNAYQTCSRCDYTTYEELAALGHAEEEIPAVAATCTEPGLTAGVKCSRCGEILTAQETIPALGHKPGTAVRENEITSTCTEKGSYDEVIYCTVCNVELSRTPKEVAALGHDLVDHEGKAPTCTEKGWKAYQTCSRCDYTTMEEIAALGHEYVEGVCTRCGAVDPDYVPPVNRTELNDAIAEAEKVEKGKYTDESMTVLEEALASAKALPENADQAAIDAAVSALKSAIAGLVEKPDVPPEADKEELEKAIAAAEELTEEDYTPETFGVLKEAVDAAKAVNDKKNATQDEVDAAAKAVNDAIAALVEKPVEEPFRFDDVKNEKAFYFNPVYWAYEAKPQITNGIDKTHFGPDQGCTRGQVVTFLWRTAGCPEPKSTDTPFTDVKAKAFYAKAVAWAVENGITKGMTDTTFEPDTTCTRGQIVTFLYRFKESPAPKSTETPFTDVNPKAFYTKAVAWAVEEGVTKGMTDTTFAPNDTCTRGQIVTFLYRATKEK